MSNPSGGWQYSQEHRKYYRQYYQNGKWESEWQKDDREATPTPRPRLDSGAGSGQSGYAPTYAGTGGSYSTPTLQISPQANLGYGEQPNLSQYPQGASSNLHAQQPQYEQQYPQGSSSNLHAQQQQYEQQYHHPPQPMQTYTPNQSYHPPSRQQHVHQNLSTWQDQPVSASASTQPEYFYRDSGARTGTDRGQGLTVRGTWGVEPKAIHYETLDQSYFVNPRSFFQVGRMFSVLFTEPAGTTAPTLYNDSLTLVKYGEMAYSQIRRFVVVRSRHEFCFACPVFTYSGKATLKPGVRAAEHAIIYTVGNTPQLLPGETGVKKSAIAVIPAPGVDSLSIPSRIYFGIHHPIQYNVKVKDFGVVCDDDIPTLVGYWKEEQGRGP